MNTWQFTIATILHESLMIFIFHRIIFSSFPCVVCAVTFVKYNQYDLIVLNILYCPLNVPHTNPDLIIGVGLLSEIGGHVNLQTFAKIQTH